MIILGCNLPNRFTEQHDVFFGISDTLADLKQNMIDFWPETNGRMHIDSYRIVRKVGAYEICIVDKDKDHVKNDLNLYFLNLGGYKQSDMEEYHYKQLVVAKSMSEAISIAKQNTFWKHHESWHVDNKYGIDVDDAYLVEDMLPSEVRSNYSIQIIPNSELVEEERVVVGYLKLDKLK